MALVRSGGGSRTKESEDQHAKDGATGAGRKHSAGQESFRTGAPKERMVQEGFVEAAAEQRANEGVEEAALVPRSTPTVSVDLFVKWGDFSERLRGLISLLLAPAGPDPT